MSSGLGPRILWSGENKIELSGLYLEEHQVQRNPGTTHDPSKAIPTEKQGGGCGSDWTGSPPKKTLTLTLS